MAFLIAGASVAGIALTLSGDSPHTRADGIAKRALATWSRSCAASVDGLCVTRVPTESKHCGPESANMLVVTARTAEAATARSELAGAVALYDGGLGGDRHEYAMAKLALVDSELEHYLGIGFPANLDFDPAQHRIREANIQRFDVWIRLKSELSMHLRHDYETIAALGDPVGTIVATSRMGTIAATFADALFTAEIPEAVRAGEFAEDKVDAYCDALTSVAETMDAQATRAFTTCVTRAREHAHDANVRDIVDAAQPCFEALARSQPGQFPSLDEVFDAPERTRMRMQLGVADDVDAGRDYDQLNTLGVALRIQGDFVRARGAYERAIALDDLRPEAHFNVALLEELEATKVELNAAAEHYARAFDSFERAAVRSNGELRADALARVHDAQMAFHQIHAFMAAQN